MGKQVAACSFAFSNSPRKAANAARRPCADAFVLQFLQHGRERSSGMPMLTLQPGLRLHGGTS